MFGEDGVDVESDVLVYFHFSFTMVWIGDADDSGLNLKASILRVVACGHVIIEYVKQLVVIECLEDDIITVFMVDRNVIKRNAENSWKMVSLEPKGFFAQKAYYKTLNKSIANDNENLKKQLRDSVELNWKEESFSKEKLLKLNSKLAKILKEKVVFE